MNRLLDIGFQVCGHWHIQENRLIWDLIRFAAQKNILYAFVSDGEVMYVGKTVQTLSGRMGGYKNPGPSQTTNVRNHARIRELILRGAAVEILALPDNGLHHYGVFHLNLAAGLEDDIIRLIRPSWNGGAPVRVQPDDANTPALAVQFAQHTFTLVMGPTYHGRGFFNVGVADQRWIGGDGETIEIFLGEAEQPVTGTINRRANTNGTPRVLGGTAVRDWFALAGKPGDQLEVQVYSTNSIRLRVPGSEECPVSERG